MDLATGESVLAAGVAGTAGVIGTNSGTGSGSGTTEGSKGTGSLVVAALAGTDSAFPEG